AKAGRHVLIEKPVAATSPAAHWLDRELKGLGTLAVPGFQHRFNPGIQEIKRRIEKGFIGTLSSISIQHAVAGPPRPTEWRNDAASSGGWSISDLGAHLLDTALYLVGHLDLVAARLSSPARGLTVDDLSCLLLVQGEATVSVRASTGTPGPPSSLEVSGTEGWVRLSDFWGGGGQIADSTGHEERLSARDLYVEEVEAFAAAVDGEEWAGASVEEGVWSVEVVEAARDLDARCRARSASDVA
ncbi:MAG: Gfo/Idh/MocA family protein, partial [Acidimicrobiales bacterium]